VAEGGWPRESLKICVDGRLWAVFFFTEGKGKLC
jgi:hypothetical protein